MNAQQHWDLHRPVLLALAVVAVLVVGLTGCHARIVSHDNELRPVDASAQLRYFEACMANRRDAGVSVIAQCNDSAREFGEAVAAQSPKRPEVSL